MYYGLVTRFAGYVNSTPNFDDAYCVLAHSPRAKGLIALKNNLVHYYPKGELLIVVVESESDLSEYTNKPSSRLQGE